MNLSNLPQDFLRTGGAAVDYRGNGRYGFIVVPPSSNSGNPVGILVRQQTWRSPRQALRAARRAVVANTAIYLTDVIAEIIAIETEASRV